MARNKDEHLEEAEEDYQAAVKQQIALRAAKLVVNGVPRDQALGKAQRIQEAQDEAACDPTGTLWTLAEAKEPSGPHNAEAQVRAIASELVEKLA